MKRKILFCIFILFLKFVIYSQDFIKEIEWIVTEDTQLKLYDNQGYITIKKNTELSPFKFTHYDETENLLTYIFYNNNEGDINADKVIPKNTKELILPELTKQNLNIFPYYNFDILQKKDRTIINTMIYKTFQSLKGEWYTEQECYEYVLEGSGNSQLLIKNSIIVLTVYNRQNSFFYINNINKITNGYKCNGILKNARTIEDLFITTPIEGPHTLLILFDGDYINVYEDTKDKLLMTYAITDEKTLNEFNNLILTGKCDLSKVTWPRHADGTSPYDNQIKPAKFNFESLGKENKSTTKVVSTGSTTNVSVNKQMTVTENLKLRSGEATTTSVLTVMQAGTKVKILQLGKAETIDGINSNWVKVEVQKGGKDRDGKEIKEGTVGWCYGGYLK